MATDTKVKDLVINRLTKEQYDAITSPNQNELYFVQQDIENANADLSNLTTTGKQKVSTLSAPSSKNETLTLGATASQYTAPANGWMAIAKKATAASQYIQIRNVTAGFIVNGFSVGAEYVDIYIPLQKGQVAQVDYSVAGETIYFKFIYAEGDK